MKIKQAVSSDLAFLAAHDEHIARAELEESVVRGRVLIAWEGAEPIGWLRWNLFWDNTPFMNLLYVLGPHQARGCGRALVQAWEARMRAAGYTLVMTSTRADETAQHFYRKLGYTDAGALLLPSSPLEIFFIHRTAVDIRRGTECDWSAADL